MKFLRLVISVLSLVLVFSSTLLAQPPTADEINAIAKHLNCPTCDTRSLAACDTVTCIQWKKQIGDLMVEGYTESEILDWYVARYGDYVLQQPPTRGLGLIAWLLPIVVFLAAAIWLGFIIRSWRAKQPVVISPTDDAALEPDNEAVVDDEYLRRVEQDLQHQK